MDLSELSEVATGRYALSGEKFAQLKSFINFTKVRIFCRKPYTGRTLHAVFEDDITLKNLVQENKQTPDYCQSRIRYLSDDNSNIKNIPCDKIISGDNPLNIRLYDHFFYVNYESHVIITRKNRFECEDYIGLDNYPSSDPNFSPIGVWYFYLK